MITPFVPNATNWRSPRDFRPVASFVSNARQPYQRYPMPQPPAGNPYMPRHGAHLPYPDMQQQHFQDQYPYPYDQFTPMPSEFASTYRRSPDGNMPPREYTHQQQHEAIRPADQGSVTAFQSSPDHNINIGNYIHAQFGNREFSDYVVQLSHSRYLLSLIHI